MTLGWFLVNIILACLAFLLVKYVGSMVMPDGDGKDKIVSIVGVLAGIVVFFANFAANFINHK